MRSPIGLYLAEFRSGPAPALVPDDLALFEADDGGAVAILPETCFPALPPPVVPEADEVLDDIPREPEPDLAEVIAALQADHAAALGEARRRWVADESEPLVKLLSEALQDLEDRLAGTLAPMLEPFLVQAAQLKALDELRAAIRTLLSAEGRSVITVAGPPDLLAALASAQPGEPRLAFAIADATDVTITVADTAVRSRLQEWASTLQASLGDGA